MSDQPGRPAAPLAGRALATPKLEAATWVPIDDAANLVQTSQARADSQGMVLSWTASTRADGSAFFHRFAVPQVILDAQYTNPPFDVSNPDWSNAIAANSTFLSGSTPPWEWTPVTRPLDQFDDGVVCVGTAVDVKLSTQDNPFLHPFGFDYTFGIAMDPPFEPLLARNNRVINVDGSPNPTADNDSKVAVAAAAALGVGVPGALHIETDQGLVPSEYRAHDGDRVVVLGRWIIDCGHDNFTSEIHPPLLHTAARSVSAGETYASVISRPYLVGQNFGDGGLFDHLLNEIGRCVPIPVVEIPRGTHLEAHPQVYTTPFSGMYLVIMRVRPSQPRHSPYDKLYVTYHFTTRSGVVVEVFDGGNDSVGVAVLVTDDLYTASPLPAPRELNVSIDDLDVLKPGLGATVKQVFAGVTAGAIALPVIPVFDPISIAVLVGILNRGIHTDRYPDPIPTSPADGTVHSAPLDALPSQPHFSVDDNQPFPVYGFIDVSWGVPAMNPPWGPHSIVSTWSGMALEINGPDPSTGATVAQFANLVDDGAPVIQGIITGAANQQWLLVPRGDGYFKIVNRSTGKALDVADGSTSDGAAVVQYRDNGAVSQQWSLLVANCESYMIMSRATGKVLVATGPVVQASPSGDVSERWKIEDVDGHWVKFTTEKPWRYLGPIGHVVYPSRVLEVPAGASLLRVGDDIDEPNQHWLLSTLDGGYTKITSRATGQVLDLPGFADGDGVQVQQFADNGGMNQQWALVPVKPVYRLVSRASGKALDFTSGQAAIQPCGDAGGPYQTWTIEPAV